MPIFFVYTGVTFDLQALFAEPMLFLLLPVVLVALLVVRGLPSTLAAPQGSTARERVSIALLGATGAADHRRRDRDRRRREDPLVANAALLVGAGMLSVLVFPLVAMTHPR